MPHRGDPVFDIIGARLHGPDPIEDVFVPWRGGLSALYGLNGAGKSRILGALRDLYAGVPEPSHFGWRNSILVRISGGLDQSLDVHADGYGWTLAFPFKQHIGSVLNRTVRPWQPGHSDRRRARQASNEPEPRVLRESIYRWLVAHEPNMGISPAIAREILDQGIFTLTPTAPSASNARSPSWHIGFAVVRDPAQPLITDAIDRFIAGWYDVLARAGVSKHDTESFSSDEVEAAWASAATERDVVGDTFLRRAIADGPTYDVEADLDTGWIGEVATLLEGSSLIPFGVCANSEWPGSPTWDGRPVEVIDVEGESELEIDRRTRRYMFDFLARDGEQWWWDRPEPSEPSPDGSVDSALLTSGGDGVVALSEGLLGAHSRLSELASSLYGAFLLDAPELGIQATSPDEWFLTGGPSWSAVDLDGSKRSLPEMSEAQQRWANVAIRLGLHVAEGADASHTLLLLDEPDAALHSTAERHAVAGLARMAASFVGAGDLSIVAATHSREFLNSTDVRLMHVFRTLEGAVALRELDNPLRERLDLLGLKPADAFQLYRVVLVVEGHHEEVILSALLGHELEEARTLVVPMRGGRHLATVVDAEVFADFSDAPVLVMLDNLDGQRIERFWSLLRKVPDDQIDSLVSECFSGKMSSEEQFVISFARRVVSSGQGDRFHVHAMSKPDIPEYLPVELLVPGSMSWEELRREFGAQTKVGSFKPWLKKRFNVDYTDDSLAQACEALDHLHEDFTSLLDTCRELGGNAFDRRTNNRFLG